MRFHHDLGQPGEKRHLFIRRFRACGAAGPTSAARQTRRAAPDVRRAASCRRVALSHSGGRTGGGPARRARDRAWLGSHDPL